MAADKKIQFFHGPTDKIAEQIEAGAINESDFVVSSTEDSLFYIDDTKTPRNLSGSSKTKADITANLGQGSVGGIQDGTTIAAGTSLDDFLKKLLLKQVPATYKAPAVTLTATGAGNFEVGATTKVALTGTFTKNDAGDLVELTIDQSGVDEALVSGATSPAKAEATVVVPEGTVNFTATADYKEGPIKKDNLGQDSPDGHIEGGTITSDAIKVTGLRKLFFGTGVGAVPAITSEFVRGLSGSQLGPTIGKPFDIPVAVGQQYVAFAYPATLRDVNQVMYVETNDVGMATSFKLTKIAVQGATADAPTADYKVYTYGMDAPAAAPMTFRVTI